MSNPTYVQPAIPGNIVLTAQTLKNSGGAERYARDVIAGFHRIGLRPTLFAREIDRTLPEAAWIDPQRMDVWWVPRKLRNLAFNWRVSRQLHKHRPACVFSINHLTQADLVLCGGTHPGSLEALGRPPRRSDAWQIELERRSYTNATAIIAHSMLMKQELQRFYDIPAARIDVIYPPVDTKRFKVLSPEERKRVRRQLGLPEDRVVFAFASMNHERKGYELIEKFFSKTNLPVCLAVAGRPVPRTGDTIRYIGYCREIESLFGAADYTIVASTYEPFGLVGVESVMCGTPLVIADNVGSAETVTGDAKIAFSRRSEASFEQAIHTAVARAQNGCQITDPLSHLAYDPSVETHMEALCRLISAISATPAYMKRNAGNA
ncbi:glycosyltransferase family 4 protein [Paraburkholderia sp.]|uniref:glycosyltransferase family 4 protein n=1 Tax=Paraburkholderia sp. TaxID=1926495 RepID=UPI00239E8FC3|nr:glycosyltransferase family 4 protein [Paraburkholderia sp.]MDE1179042.1 glycosyltransferase family 4 protein [Paraburkholderia sp.]